MPNFDRSMPMLLNRTLDAVMPPYRALFAQFDLTEQQWRVMRVLWTTGKITSLGLSEKTLLAAPSLVGIIDRLEKKALVVRIRSTADRRVVHVVSTAKGRALEEKVTPEVERIHSAIKSTLSAAEWAVLEKTLKKIRSGINASQLNNAANL